VRPFEATATLQPKRQRPPPIRVPLCELALKKYEWISALPIAKVKVATRKYRPTSTPVFLVAAARGALRSAVTVTLAWVVVTLRLIDRSNVVVVMAAPRLVDLRCK
jgi:hypothetical protein